MGHGEEVGALQRLSPRDVFAHEAYDFTAWLEENIGVLSDVLGFDLTPVERERSAGDFSADLLAEDEGGSRVTIENQLEQTDHKHLGQVLTYLAVLDAEVAIWITADARPEHVSAVSWLNENAGGADFYLVKVEGVQVDDSRPAPLFTRIVGPSLETRSAEQTKKEWDKRDRVRYRFFEKLLECTSERTNRFSNVSPKGRRGVSASGGCGFSFGYSVSQRESRAYLYMHFGETQAVNDAAFKVFREHREEIESHVDHELDWVQDENRRRLIRHVVGVGYEDEDRWDEAHEQLARSMAQLEAAVGPYLEEAQKAADRYARQVESASDAN
ncbi:DUF4268 domain-containing protein [Salinibacter ruber]|jgi:hypothetical protein|uniref:DUF4268 domain-containing protein n=1 Tax=Salinibacter ruber TaxID=146919 RepID=UPI0020747FE0|nr:DUF4268 domain-containing protein [Salinibacter ruber]